MCIIGIVAAVIMLSVVVWLWLDGYHLRRIRKGKDQNKGTGA